MVLATNIDHSVKNALAKLHFRASTSVKLLGDILRGRLSSVAPTGTLQDPQCDYFCMGSNESKTLKFKPILGEECLNEK